VVATIRPLDPEPVEPSAAAGLVLAESLIATTDLPPFDNAAMDGVAVRSSDTRIAPVTLQVVGGSLAGHPWRGRLEAGQAISIATGGMVPTGADAVVPIEDITIKGDEVMVREPVPRGRHIRNAGEDIRAGALVLEAGTVLGPGQLAAVAAFGLQVVSVHPAPRVAILPTGDELRPAGEPLGPGQIHESISAPLAALLRELGARPDARPPAGDDRTALATATEEAAARADAVISVGGVSAGPRDLIRTLGPGVRTLQVALRPARPFAFGEVFGVPLFGLPGNPAAALAAFEELVRPAILALMGKPAEVRTTVRATLVEAFSQPPGRLHLVRVQVWRDGPEIMAKPSGRQGASMIHSLARAQGWAVIPPEVEELPAGSPVDVRLLVDVP
jgi:molybdenum cofactor synthesis domain-containing protein